MADPPLQTVADCSLALRRSSRSGPLGAAAGVLAAVAGCALPGDPVLIPLAVVLACFAAGLAAAALAKPSGIPGPLLPASALRVGARVGASAFLTGGGLFLLARSASLAAPGIAPGDYRWVDSFTAWLVRLALTALPAVAAGALGAWAGTAARNRQPRRARPRAERSRWGWRSAGYLPYAAGIFVLALLSPAVLWHLSARSPSPPEGPVTGKAAPAAAPARGVPEIRPGAGAPAPILSRPAPPAPASAQPAEAPEKERDLGAEIADFVASHHRKAGSGDVDGFAADYADTVDFPGKGLVTRGSVRSDQAEYLPRYDRLSETVEGDVSFVEAAGGWRASYVIRSFAVRRRDGQEFDRRVALTLDLRENREGRFEITRERARPAD